MKREELAALYACIKASGINREIAGMLFQMAVIPKNDTDYARYQSYFINIARIHEKERIWSMEFTANPIRFSIDADKAILMDFSINPSKIAPTYVDIVDINFYGDEDSRKHDCTLLRMFASEWGGDCGNMG